MNTEHQTHKRARGPIVILTDFGRDGFYAGAMKGAILSVAPDARLVDLTHSIEPYAIDQASFVIGAVFDVFPEGTVFLAVVDPGVGGPRKNLVLESRGRYLVAPDNGLAGDVDVCFGIERVFSVSEDAAARIRKHEARGRTFLGRDVFGPVAAFIAVGGAIGEVGEEVGGFNRLALPVKEVGDGIVRGHARYADDFGNVLTDISREDIAAAFGSLPPSNIRVIVNGAAVARGITERFSEADVGTMIALFNSWNRVEIAVNQGSAFERLDIPIPVPVGLERGRGK